MKRAIWVTCCAVVALLSAPLGAQSQDPAADEIFGLLQEEGQDPFGPGGLPAANSAQPAEKSMLDALEPTAAQSDRDFCKCVGESDSEVVQQIEKALRGPLTSTGMEFSDTPLEEVVSILQDSYSIPIQLDIPALDEIGIGPDEPVTVNLHGISLRSALRLMLKQLQLTYIVANEVLVITTPEQSESQLTVCVYDVRNLVNGSKSAPDFDSLIDAIISCVSMETWSKNGGGQAEIRPLKPGFLVISQTQAMHQEVRGLIETLHDVYSRLPARETAGAEQSAAISPASDQVVTRSYFLQMAPTNDNAVLGQIRDLITRSLPDARWNRQLEDGQPVVLSVLPDRVIVRHTQGVQKEVEALLADSGIAQAAPALGGQALGGGRGFGGGGFGGGGFGGPAGGEGEGGGFFQPQPLQGE